MVVSISPVESWNKGETVTLNTFRLQSVNDNLKDSCTFYWQIGNEIPVQPEGFTRVWVQDGNLVMGGEDYAGWSGSNDDAVSWALLSLNLQRASQGNVAVVPELKVAPVLPQ